MAELKDFVGRGLSFPFAFDPRTGGVQKDSEPSVEQRLERIRDAIQMILGIRRGELFFSRSFGSQVHDLVFRANDASIVTLVEYAVVQALETWEKRIRLDQVRVDFDPDHPEMVEIGLNYTIKRTNTPGNLVFPLYLEDAERDAADRGAGT